MKKQLKLMSLLLSLALLLISATPLTANAFDSIDADATAQLITPSANAIYSVYGSAAPVGLCRELAELDVTVTNNTLIEIVPMDSGTGTALTVTNSENATIFKDTIFGFDGNGQIVSIQPVDEGAASLLSVRSGWIPDDGWNLVKATAVYNVVYGSHIPIGGGATLEYSPFYQPQGAYFIYYGNDDDTVSYVSVLYEHTGYEFTYPAFENISGGEAYTYRASPSADNPVPNTVYSDPNANPYNAGRALYYNDNTIGGIYMEYEIIVNGTNIWGNI